MNTKEYWQKLAAEIGLPEDQAKVAEQIFSNEKIANAFVPRPDFSRSLDEQQKKYNELVAQNETYYKTEAQRAAENQKKVDEALAQAQRFRDLYGELPNDGSQRQVVQTPAFDGSKYISREDYDKELKRIEGQSLYVIKEGLKASQDYMSKFGKPLDIDALEKFAVERNLPINLAYKEMIQPELEAKQSSSFAEQLKKAREEGAAEARSRANVPIDTTPKEVSPFLSNVLRPAPKENAPLSTQDRVKNFAEAWNTATSTPKG